MAALFSLRVLPVERHRGLAYDGSGLVQKVN
jgi:hypothetical protein